MATRSTVGVSFSEADIRGLLDSWNGSKPLPMVYLRGPPADGELQREAWRAVCYLLRYRDGGFMVLALFLEEVVTHLASDAFSSADGAPGLVSKDVELIWESPRGKTIGAATAILVDFTWEAAQHFRRVQAIRISSAASPEVLRMMLEEQAVRPNVSSAWEASQSWIEELIEDDAMGEYYTGEEELVQEPPQGSRVNFVAPSPKAAAAPDLGQEDVIKQLHARIVDLEAQAAAHPTTPQHPPRIPRELFPAEQQQGPVNPQMWDKLNFLAGAAPPRLGRLEQSAAASRRSPQATSFLDAEKEAEVVEVDEYDELTQQITDPMQKMLALQLKQTNALVNRLAPRSSQDALTMALGSGSANESGSSGSGVRGCAAREVYLRQIEDSSMVARVVLRNAQKDMGISDQAVYPGLMRDYMEKKVPLGDMKLLTYMATFLGHAWEAAYIARDELMLGYISRGLMFIEQCALDAGRTQTAWLLLGLPEPNWAVTSQNRRRQALQPFARLAAPQWVAANVAFLRDLDFMETRLKASKNAKETAEEEVKPDRKPYPKKKFPKGKPSGGDTSEV